METKKSVVVGANFKKSGTGKNGPYHIFQIFFQNGDNGDYIAKSNPQQEFIIGQEKEYTKDTVQNGQYTNVKIGIPGGSGGFKSFGGSPTSQNKRTALECAVALVAAGKLSMNGLMNAAEGFDKWLNAGDKPAAQSYPPKPTPLPEPAPEDMAKPYDPSDDLPF